MNILMCIYVALLFILLTPGVLLRLPPRSSTITVAIVHSIVFVLFFHFSHKFVWEMTHGSRQMY